MSPKILGVELHRALGFELRLDYGLKNSGFSAQNSQSLLLKLLFMFKFGVSRLIGLLRKFSLGSIRYRVDLMIAFL